MSSYGIGLYETLANNAIVDGTDDEAFATLLNAAIEYCGLTDRELAETFGISRPSVELWKDGQNAPYVTMRPPVYEYLAKKVNETIQAKKKIRAKKNKMSRVYG